MKSKNKTKNVSFMGKDSDFQMHVIIFEDIDESTVCLNFSKEWYLCYSNIFFFSNKSEDGRAGISSLHESLIQHKKY